MNLYDVRKQLIKELMEYEKEIENCRDYKRVIRIRDNIIWLNEEIRKVENEIWDLENREV